MRFQPGGSGTDALAVVEQDRGLLGAAGRGLKVDRTRPRTRARLLAEQSRCQAGSASQGVKEVRSGPSHEVLDWAQSAQYLGSRRDEGGRRPGGGGDAGRG